MLPMPHEGDETMNEEKPEPETQGKTINSMINNTKNRENLSPITTGLDLWLLK